MIKIWKFVDFGQEIHDIESKALRKSGKPTFLSQHHFKVELNRYIFIVIFGKHLSELYLIVSMCF